MLRRTRKFPNDSKKIQNGLEKKINTRIPYKTNQAQKFSNPLENFEPAPKNFQNVNVRAPAGTRVSGTGDGGSAKGTAPTETQLKKIRRPADPLLAA